MGISKSMRICSAALIVMAVVSVCILIHSEPEAAATHASGAFIEEQIEVDSANARISVPVIIGLGAETDLAANRALRGALRVNDAIDFIAEMKAEKQTDWDARFRFKAWSVGGVFRVQSVMTLYENGNMPFETRREAHVDSETGELYTLASLFLESDAEHAIKKIGEYIMDAIRANPDGYLDDITPLPLPDNFYFDDGILTIYYQPGDIAPYSDGFKEFRVSADVYGGSIDKNGAFYKALTQKGLS